jgi:hypothetical protein
MCLLGRWRSLQVYAGTSPLRMNGQMLRLVPWDVETSRLCGSGTTG